MAKFCTECGKEISEGVAFCTECGAPADPKTQTNEPITEAKVKAEIPVNMPSAQNDQPRQTPPPPVQSEYARPVSDPESKVVSTGAYFWLMLLFSIPFLGFISCVLMSFAPKNKNLKHFSRATLIWTIIGLVTAGLLVAVIMMLANSLTDYLSGLVGGQFGGLKELFGNLGAK